VNDIPLWAQILTLALLVMCSAFFSISETALMAANRHRLRHLSKQGNKFAQIVLWLLDHVDRVLSLILIGNTLLNALVSALITAMTIQAFGNNETTLTLTTGIVAFLLIIFAEIFPKIIGATYPERIALLVGLPLRLLLIPSKPFVWFVNLFVSALLKISRIKTGKNKQEQRLSPEELRSIVLEGGNFIPQKHKSILLNLFELENISVEDIMTPRVQIEALNIAVPIEEIKNQLVTCYHNKLPVYEGEINKIIGILHVRKAVGLLSLDTELTAEHLRSLLTPPYFIPQETGVFSQLQYFQENHERLGIIVDEYGEIQGLVSLEDIIEEMIGEFTTSTPGATRADTFVWDKKYQCFLEGSTALRDINKRLGINLPLNGPKTLNGLLLELLQDIPEANLSIKIGHVVMDIIQVQNQSIKMVKLIHLKPQELKRKP
jgi:Mg2+/Co2+ transporter CorB